MNVLILNASCCTSEVSKPCQQLRQQRRVDKTRLQGREYIKFTPKYIQWRITSKIRILLNLETRYDLYNA